MTAEQSIDEEFEVLKCIFGDDIQIAKLGKSHSLQYQISISEEVAHLVLEIGESYPSDLHSVVVSVNVTRRLRTFYSKAESIYETVWEENPGGNV